MILLDVNLLLYAYFPLYPEHDAARAWLEQCLDGPGRVGIPWASLLGFVRIASNGRLFEDAPSVAEAWRVAASWRELESVWIPQPTSHHRALVDTMLRSARSSRLVPDAHLAALAVGHGLTLLSADDDFARFPGLSWEKPPFLMDSR